MTHSLALRRWALAAGLSALTLTACSNPIDQRGNLPDEKFLTQIQPGVTDKATVTRLIGSPSSVATFDTDTWYYISQKTREVAFFKPELVDQEVLAIDFTKEGVVRDVRHRGLDDRVAVVPDPKATPAPGREFTFLEQLIGNFGRFSGKAADSGGGAAGPTGGNGGTH
jgi:outer membrane protein assembly factor BamE (lipoprotein component of BamABCDE complex)